MKRWMAWLLALVMILGMAGCSDGQSADKQTEKPAEKATAEATEETEEPPKREPITLRTGEKAEFEFMELCLNTAEATSQIPILSERAETGSYLTSKENETFVSVHGTLKNCSTGELDTKNIKATMIINNELSYSAQVNVYHGNHFNTTIAPLEEGYIYVFARVPSEIAESVEACGIELLFNDLLEGQAEGTDEYTYYYAMAFSTEEGAENAFTVNKFEPVELALGDTIETEFVKIKLKEVKVKKKLKEKYKGTTYSYGTDTSMRVLCIIGTIKNKSKAEYNPCFSGKIVIDGYEYEIKDWQLCRGLNVAPLHEAPLYIFAEIPPSLAKSYSSFTLTFGFDENFSNKWYSDITMLPYTYTLTYNKPAKK